jgi:DNA mismatch repair protein MutS2
MKVAIDEIIGVEGASALRSSPAASRNITVTSQPGEGAASGEINVIGMRVQEATERVDKYLDEAALANQTSVRIIHGHGTGALRKGLAEFLKTHPLVERTTFETEERGGKAITVVELRS